MLILYYGNSPKEAYYNDPILADKASIVMKYNKNYSFVNVVEVMNEKEAITFVKNCKKNFNLDENRILNLIDKLKIKINDKNYYKEDDLEQILYAMI